MTGKAMPAPGVSPTVKTILRQALAAETAATGGGLTFLNSIQTSVVAVLVAGGQKMVSASEASKSFAFADGWSTSALASALDEAFAIWDSLDADELRSLLNTRPVRVTNARYGYCRR